MHKDDLVYIDHLKLCIKKIKQYTENTSKEQFLDNELIQDAVVRNFEIIGEATKNLSDDFKNSHPHIPWKEIAGMRDKLIHHYMGIDVEVVWKTIEEDILFLENELSKIISPE